MPKNVIITDRTDLESVAVPADVVSHKYIMDNLEAELTASGYSIKSEVFHRNLNGEVATGIYVLNYPNADVELDLTISWTNTYDRTMKFKCAIGAYIRATESHMLIEDSSGVKVNPLDKPEVKALAIIKDRVANIAAQYAACVTAKDEMQINDMSKKEVASLAGRIYFEDGITSSQLIKAKDALKKGYADIWNNYASISGNLDGCHPKSWMSQHIVLHSLTMETIADKQVLTISSPGEEEVVDPNQTSLLDEIDDINNVNNSSAPSLNVDKPLSLEDYADKIEPQVESDPGAVVTVTEPEPEELLEATAEEDTDFNVGDLNSSDADTDSKFVQNPDALSLDAHNTTPEVVEQTEEEVKEEVIQMEAEAKAEAEGSTEGFPEAPADLAKDATEHLLSTEANKTNLQESIDQLDKGEVIPLEDQVASEFVEPVSEEEKAVSAAPIVDEPVTEQETQMEQIQFENTDKPKEEEEKEDEDLAFLKEGPTQDPVFSPQEDKSSSEHISADDPFEF